MIHALHSIGVMQQQEAWMRWLLLRYFGHHMTYPISIGVLVFGTLYGTHMMWQQGAWLYWSDMTFYISISMLLLHELHYDDVRW